MNHLKSAWSGLTGILFPRLCCNCSTMLLQAEEVLCIRCTGLLPLIPSASLPGNETEMRLAGRFHFRHAASLAYFSDGGLLQQLIHRLKYQHRRDIGIYLGRRLGMLLQEAEWILTIDGIVPVPLHPSREAARGYNQSLLIAQGMSSVLHIPVHTGLLVRSVNTGSQTRRSRQERMENPSGGFRLRRKPPEGHLLLTDDVLTTGATIEACARTLLSGQPGTLSFVTAGLTI